MSERLRVEGLCPSQPMCAEASHLLFVWANIIARRYT
jgi:hypothetical protein